VATISLTLNGRSISIEADPEMPLLWALRDSLGLLGTKFGCGGGFCGTCTVHVDGTATRSCTLPLGRITGRTIVTIEGLSSSAGGCGQVRAGGDRQSPPACAPGSHPLQRAWMELDVPQCGYCQVGQIMTAAALLARTPNPSDEQIAAAMQGNLCRCGTYMRIREAVKRAAAQMTTRISGGPR
jgi:isoquinoline 1-oxidoreductase alpha subunit